MSSDNLTATLYGIEDIRLVNIKEIIFFKFKYE